MAKKPNVPCAGTCGRLLWSGRGTLPPGQATCRACRSERARALPPPPPNATCGYCVKPFLSVRRSNGIWTQTCSMSCARHLRLRQEGKLPGHGAARAKARHRAKVHRRKTIGRYTDVTPAYEQSMREQAKQCQICRVQLIAAPYQPASKELDHIVPLNVGGTHTIGNVRIICRSCNLARPLDGSDYVGPVTLWSSV